jgi:hypothetical protein
MKPIKTAEYAYQGEVTVATRKPKRFWLVEMPEGILISVEGCGAMLNPHGAPLRLTDLIIAGCGIHVAAELLVCLNAFRTATKPKTARTLSLPSPRSQKNTDPHRGK